MGLLPSWCILIPQGFLSSMSRKKFKVEDAVDFTTINTTWC